MESITVGVPPKMELMGVPLSDVLRRINEVMRMCIQFLNV